MGLIWHWRAARSLLPCDGDNFRHATLWFPSPPLLITPPAAGCATVTHLRLMPSLLTPSSSRLDCPHSCSLIRRCGVAVGLGASPYVSPALGRCCSSSSSSSRRGGGGASVWCFLLSGRGFGRSKLHHSQIGRFSSLTEKQDEISNDCFIGPDFGGPHAHSDGFVILRDPFLEVCVLIVIHLSSWDPIPVVYVIIALIAVFFMV